MLNAHTIRKIAVESMRDPRTVRKVIEQGATEGVVAVSVREAAKRLGIQLPQRATQGDG